MRRTPRTGASTTGAIRPSRSSRRIRHTARVRRLAAARARRVSRHGQEPSPRRHRSDPRRGVQSHRRRRTRTGRRFATAAWTTATYYILDRIDRAMRDFTGSGNTLNANQPDRAPVDSGQPALLGRGDAHRRLPFRSGVDSRRETRTATHCPTRPCSGTSTRIRLLAGTKLIAEAWDAAGLYQVGSFVGDAWQEWNGRFRDDVRGFVKGDDGLVPRARGADPSAVQTSMVTRNARWNTASIFVTCHDGLHAQRPRLLQRQAQRGQWRGQPRRGERQLAAGTAASKATSPDVHDPGPDRTNYATVRSRTSWR